MDQLEQDKEIVEFCKKSLSFRKRLSGEEHEVFWYLLITKEISEAVGPARFHPFHLQPIVCVCKREKLVAMSVE